MPPTIKGSFQGTAGAFQQSTQNMGLLLVMATVVVYIILGILYESFIHPLTILSGLPSAAVGALLTLWIVGMPITLYAFVGMIMLIGIVKKNAIMMIDFALQRQRENARIGAEQAIYRSGAYPLPSHHDDDDGGDDGHSSHRVWDGNGSGFPAATGPLCCRRIAAVAIADALYHAGHLYLSRPGGTLTSGDGPRPAAVKSSRRNRCRSPSFAEVYLYHWPANCPCRRASVRPGFPRQTLLWPWYYAAAVEPELIAVGAHTCCDRQFLCSRRCQPHKHATSASKATFQHCGSRYFFGTLCGFLYTLISSKAEQALAVISVAKRTGRNALRVRAESEAS